MRDRSFTSGAGLALVGLSLWLACSSARGDGGTLRISQPSGDYTVSAFTSPTPLRVGKVDVSVLVQDSATSRAAPGAAVFVVAAPLGRRGETLRQRATADQAVNKLFQVAEFQLPEAGRWEFSIEIAESPRSLSFAAEVAEPLPRWSALLPWIGWPWLVVAAWGANRLLRPMRKPRRVSGSSCVPLHLSPQVTCPKEVRTWIF